MQTKRAWLSLTVLFLGLMVGSIARSDQTSCQQQGGVWCSIPSYDCGITHMGGQSKCCFPPSSCNAREHSCVFGFIPIWGSVNCDAPNP